MTTTAKTMYANVALEGTKNTARGLVKLDTEGFAYFPNGSRSQKGNIKISWDALVKDQKCHATTSKQTACSTTFKLKIDQRNGKRVVFHMQSSADLEQVHRAILQHKQAFAHLTECDDTASVCSEISELSYDSTLIAAAAGKKSSKKKSFLKKPKFLQKARVQ